MKKVAIFVDWENIRKGIFQEASTVLAKKVDYNDINNVIKFFHSFIDSAEEEIYRTYVYLAEPYGGMIGSTNYKNSPVYVKGMQFIKNIQSRDYIAVRKGRETCLSWFRSEP